MKAATEASRFVSVRWPRERGSIPWLWVPLLLAASGSVFAVPSEAAKPAANVCRKVESLAGLPPQVQALLGVRRHGFMGIADRGQDFNATDMLSGDMPSRRLRRACMSGGQVIVMLDLGGIAMHGELKTFAKKRNGTWSKSRGVVVWSGKLSVSDEALRRTLDDAFDGRHPPPPSS